jgi:DNA-binding CsgD family transcriptional regulator
VDANLDAMSSLRPVERRVLRLAAEDVEHREIARRFRRSPEFITRVIELAELPGRAAEVQHETLRPLERRILHLREDGLSHAEIGSRFLRSPGFVERVEGLAHYKLSSR